VSRYASPSPPVYIPAASQGATKLLGLDQKSAEGYTALHYATMHAHKRVVEMLLDAHAHPTIKDGHAGEPPLSFATTEAIRKMLLEAAVKRPYRVLPGANKLLKQLNIRPVRMGGY